MAAYPPASPPSREAEAERWFAAFRSGGDLLDLNVPVPVPVPVPPPLPPRPKTPVAAMEARLRALEIRPDQVAKQGAAETGEVVMAMP